MFQKFEGYSVNITETNDDDDKPNHITEFAVKTATAADNSYLQDSVKILQARLQAIQLNVSISRCFKSDANRAFADANYILFLITGLQGKQPEFNISFDDKYYIPYKLRFFNF